jgi:hypothetical protein
MMMMMKNNVRTAISIFAGLGSVRHRITSGSVVRIPGQRRDACRIDDDDDDDDEK